MTQAELARRIGTSKSVVCKIERGRQPVPLSLLPKLERVTGITARVLRPDLGSLFARSA